MPEHALQGTGYQDSEGRVSLWDMGRDGGRRELPVEALVSYMFCTCGFNISGETDFGTGDA